jgi:hypothetical protein
MLTEPIARLRAWWRHRRDARRRAKALAAVGVEIRGSVDSVHIEGNTVNERRIPDYTD